MNHLEKLQGELCVLYQTMESGAFGLGAKRVAIDLFYERYNSLKDALPEQHREGIGDVLETLNWAWMAMSCYYPMRFGYAIDYLRNKVYLN